MASVQVGSKSVRSVENLADMGRQTDFSVLGLIHDMKSPINQVEGLLRIALRLSNDEESSKIIQMALESNKHLSTMVHGLLDASRGEGKDLINLEKLIQSIIPGLQGVDGFEETNIDIHIEQKTLFYSNRALLRSIIRNIIENAIKYRKDDSECNRINISAFPKTETMVIRFEDNGQGISDDFLHLIFERSFKISSNKGHGLGLFTARKNACKLGGQLTVESEFGVGSVFTLEIPIARQTTALLDSKD